LRIATPTIARSICATSQSRPQTIKSLPQLIDSTPQVIKSVAQVIKTAPQSSIPLRRSSMRLREVIDSAAQVNNTAAQVIDSAAQVNNTAAQVIDSAAQVINTAAQVIDSIPQVINNRSAGRRFRSAGLRTRRADAKSSPAKALHTPAGAFPAASKQGAEAALGPTWRTSQRMGERTSIPWSSPSAKTTFSASPQIQETTQQSRPLGTRWGHSATSGPPAVVALPPLPEPPRVHSSDGSIAPAE
jgi:uncharacterized phage infection (PIP) family protein YhgE